MVTFIIPSAKNPHGLYATLYSIKENSLGHFQCIVLLDHADPALSSLVDVCKHPELSPLSVRYMVFESPSFIARVNHAATRISTPYACVLNDDIMLGKYNEPLEGAISHALSLSVDTIIALYLCLKDEGDNGYRFPIISKRYVELTGYFYHPICATQRLGEMWTGSVFDRIGRIRKVTGVQLVQNTEFPTQLTFNPSVVSDAEFLYNRCTGKVRSATSEMLKAFLVE